MTERSMTTATYLPFDRLRSQMDRLMHHFFDDFQPFSRVEIVGPRAFPPLNVWEDEEHLFVEAETPGFTREAITLTVTGDELTIEGERPEMRTAEQATVLQRERRAGSFSRVVRLPVLVDEEQIEAVLDNGILTITLPKARSSRTRRIEVRSSTAG